MYHDTFFYSFSNLTYISYFILAIYQLYFIKRLFLLEKIKFLKVNSLKYLTSDMDLVLGYSNLLKKWNKLYAYTLAGKLAENKKIRKTFT